MDKVSAVEVNQRMRENVQNGEAITVSKWRAINLDLTLFLYSSAPFLNRDDIKRRDRLLKEALLPPLAHQTNGSNSDGRQEGVWLL